MKTRTSKAGNSKFSQQGFTYIVLLVALVVMGIMADVLNRSSVQQRQREVEKELLFRGKAYYDAIKSYYQSSTVKQYPKQIDDLLLDNRFAFKRHLRQAYSDPISGGEWRLLRNRKGQIVGVASSSEKRPLKQENFPLVFEHFTEADHYHQWEFSYVPGSKNKTNISH